ncbi:MAG: hypothetical protein HY271_02865 [Deltaproteobacteria bacterium]|nr:hypothetical protein [Deltaproteobacteria bacterium]
MRACSNRSTARRALVLAIVAVCVGGGGRAGVAETGTSLPLAPTPPASTPLAAPPPAAPAALTVPTLSLAETPVLPAPSERAGADLDLHQAWRSAHVRQVLWPGERSSFQQFADLVVLQGDAHRALLLLPSSDGLASRASFKVAIPAASDCELVAWVALEGKVGALSDGIDFGAGVVAGGADPDAAPIPFARLGPGAGTAWREVRVDLAPYAGTTVWIVFAARETGDAAGDWLLWADPRVRLKAPSETVLDVTQPDVRARRLTPVPWSEVNLFKPYSVFRNDPVTYDSMRWLARTFPWLTSVRLFSALGANWGPTLERDYDGQMGKNPTFDGSWETPLARTYEFFHDGAEWEGRPLRSRFDWTSFDRLLDALGGSEMGLHVNLAGAPETFTAHRGHYATYHFNEMPVVDEVGWKEYVQKLFQHLTERPWFARAHVSFFNEPNCRWTDADGTVRRFGYQGDAADYARQYFWTWQAMKPYVGPGQVHLGPWVAEPDAPDPVVNNLPVFLRALHREFERAAEPLPPWSGFAFNIYDTPQLTLEAFATAKIAPVRTLLEAEFPGTSLPVRFDEIGLHPVIASVFERAGAGTIDETRWATAWRAEMLALLVEQGIDRASPWVSTYTGHGFAPYFFASYVAHAVDYRVSSTNEIAITRDEVDPPQSLSVRLASHHADRIGALWSSSDDGREFRVAVWRYPRFPSSDARLIAEAQMLPVELRLPAARGRVWRLRVLGDAAQRLPETGEALAVSSSRSALRVRGAPTVPPLAMRELIATARVRLEMGGADVFLIEATASDARSLEVPERP